MMAIGLGSLVPSIGSPAHGQVLADRYTYGSSEPKRFERASLRL
jgi:hypothetical protein